eukprot:TRINITY_DN36880_c0_g1_i1.p1 TRINITY_DN36880_c0_g1~~TRINITY_DN36880_c0_g1_i1.p1  ORF type:complete len:537 (-),score=68.16 TRINITY_DN36880_c0_g1_i1:284-1894(-)
MSSWIFLRAGLLIAAAFGQAPSLQKELETVLATYAQIFNTSYSVAVRTAEGSVTAAAGTQDHATGQPMTSDAMIPAGSVTKAWTAVATVRLVESGKISYNDTVSKLVDSFLMRTNGTTLLKLWGDDRIDRVTVYQLLHMSSGLADYDDKVVQKLSIDAGRELSPYDYLYMVNKSFAFEPGSGGAYTSVGYGLLGFVLAATANASTWQEYDQLRGAVSEDLLSEFSAVFAKSGSCEQYKDMAHQYTLELQGQGPPIGAGITLSYFDIVKGSCLNGWAFGNLIARASDLANFFYFLLATPYRVLPVHRLAEMVHFDPLTTGFAPGLPYGLGLMYSALKTVDGRGEAMIGHAGQDYGSAASIAHFIPAWNVSVAIMTNTVFGMNCSLAPPGHPEVFSLNFKAHEITACHVLDAVLQSVSQGQASRLDCGVGTAPPASLLQSTRQQMPPSHYGVPSNLTLRGVDKLSAPLDAMVCRPYCAICNKAPCIACKACVGHATNPLCAACYKELDPKSKFACLYPHPADGHGCQQCWGPGDYVLV